MNFLKKLFGTNKNSENVVVNTATIKPLDNTRLTYLMNVYAAYPSDDNSQAVFDELVNGNCYLLLPSVHNGKQKDGWRMPEPNEKFELSSVYDLDGLLALGAFTDDKALMDWSKTANSYTEFKANTVLQMCEKYDIDRLVINSGRKDMYILEKKRDNIKEGIVEKNTKFLITPPERPLEQATLDKLSLNFKRVDTVLEAYQYTHHYDGQTALVLGVRLSVNSDNSRTAMLNAINSALSKEKIDQPLDIRVLVDDNLLESLKEIKNSLFYTREQY